MSTRCHKYAFHKESGAVLITGLIFMVVMTIIVISALRSSTLEERMAANARNRQVALQAAEAVLRDAEAALSTAPFDPFTPASFTAGCTNGYCNVPATGSDPRWKTSSTWSDTTKTRSFVSSTSNLSGVASQPRYIVEIVGFPVPSAPGQKCNPALYQVTSRGVGPDNSIVFVQTMYRHRPTTC